MCLKDKYVIRNENLEVVISNRGAEMKSIKDQSGVEYLWQGDSEIWGESAPNLFPYIGRLYKESYLYQGEEYHMNIHGFLSNSILEVSQVNENEISFSLSSNENTRRVYPFKFLLEITYKVENTKICIIMKVQNNDTKKMYFGIGGHPGFQVPLGGEGEFEDYYLEFERSTETYRIGMDEESVLRNYKDVPYALEQDTKIMLSHTLFDEDAIILGNTCGKVTLKSDVFSKYIAVSYPSMPYLGIWHRPYTKADYVCIEPWSSLPGDEGKVIDIAMQKDLIGLDSGKRYVNEWNIEIGI